VVVLLLYRPDNRVNSGTAFMLGRALIAFFVLPGFVAGLVPAMIFTFDPWRERGYTIGYIFTGSGVFLLIWCVRDFYVSGKGTLAPWSPPSKLVVVGLYRLLRNPMYASVLLILVGWCLISGSAVLAAYTVFMATMFHLRVTRNEELWLEQEFGADWAVYSQAVGRWLPRLRPWYPHEPGA
jgi:protein-S-isoprenylcysteine O-methyltransferase Ste14